MKIAVNLHMFLTKFKQYYEAISTAIAVRDNWHSVTKCDVLLVGHVNNRGYRYKNQSYAQLLDSLGDLMRQKGLVIQSIDEPFSRSTHSNSYGKPLVFNRKKLLIMLKHLPIRLIKGTDYSRQWVERQTENLWRKILDHSRPRIIIAIQPDKSLCRAGRVEQITVCDLQHGLIDSVTNPYYRELVENAANQDLPNVFLCWDSRTASIFEKLTVQKGIAVHVLGNPWFQRFFTVDPDDLLVQEALTIQKPMDNTRSTILVSLQWGITQHFGQYVTNGVMPDALEKTILNTAKSYNWLIRLHPVQIRGSESSMVQSFLTKTFGHLSTVEWQQSSEVPLPILLKWSDLHITYSSATTIEASWMGIYTGLLDPEVCPGGKSSHFFSHERSLGIAETIPLNSSKIETWIKSTLNNGKAKSTLERNANFKSFIDNTALQILTCKG